MSQAFEFEQAQFEAEFNTTKDEASSSDRWFRVFGLIAYGLKATAIFGGIAITAGLPEQIAQAVGVLIMVAVGCDALLSNQKRLIASAVARVTYRNLLEDVMFKHTNALSTHIPKKQTNEDLFFISMTRELKKLREELFQGRKEVKKALEKAELVALESLNIESKQN